MSRQKAIDSIIRRILAGEAKVHSLDWIKRAECKRYGISNMIKNPEILSRFPKDRLIPELKTLLLKRPMRTLSGVTPVAVMIKPQGSCVHHCIYCPTTNLAAKSYSGFEPAALRSRQAGFDPCIQASGRVAQYEGAGHPADKCEIIIMGGTFLEMDPEYKRSFVKGVYDGLNGSVSGTMEDAIHANEGARHRAIGLTLETRPDACINHIPEMLSYGATRVELGVQHADDRIYRIIRRGHTVKDVVASTRALKDASFKVLYHIMPGLPGSSIKKDISFVRKLFSSGSYQPDMLKIYPTLVLDGTPLKGMADRGDYEPYSTEEAADVISEFYRHIPPYVRVMRIQRDIPSPLIERGVKKSNLRELVEKKVAEKGIIPREIRYREAGLQGKKAPDPSGFSMKRLDYLASGGKERFLSYENDEGLIAAFIRLRYPGKGQERKEIEKGPCIPHEPEAGHGAALIRELHVYGCELPLNVRGGLQHSGFGSSLLREAEALASGDGWGRMRIISGVGAREYYRKFGYSLQGPYMERKL
jgi:elongator complex protein 3